MRAWLFWMAVGMLLLSCAKPPPPPLVKKPEPQPQLEFAIVLAEQTINMIVSRHVTPIEGDMLIAQLAKQTRKALASATSTSHQPLPANQDIGAMLRALHKQYPRQPILPAVESALTLIAQGLGDRSRYLDQQQNRALANRGADSSASIGVYIKAVGQQVIINEVVEGSPADRAGLKPGDRLLNVDGQPVSGIPLEWVVSGLRGEPGSMLGLTIEFEDGDNRTLGLQRERLEVASVEGRWLTHGIAYLRIRSLLNSTVSEFNQAFLGLVGRVGAPRGLILDLRDNSGGLLDTAVQLTDIFLEQGTILKIQGRTSSDSRRFTAQPKSEVLEHKLPIVVLINGNTAAGAESMAAALQDNHRAVLVGKHTTGVGLVHTVYALPGERALKLATSYLYRPSGELLEQRGVVPDVCVSDKSYRIIKPEKPRAPVADPCKQEFSRGVDDADMPMHFAQQILVNKNDYQQLLNGTLTSLQQP